MMHCDTCGVDYTGKIEHCPLCGNSLQGTPDPAAFPIQEVKAPAKAARRTLWAITGAAIIFVAIAGAMAGMGAWHIVFACAALVVNCIFLCNIAANVPDFIRIAERWFLALLAISVFWWWAFDVPWVGWYVIPSVCLAATISNTILLIVFRDSFVQGYAKYLLYDIVLGFIPIVFVLVGWVSWIWLSVASAAAAVVLTILLVLLSRKQIASEIEKLFTA